MSTTSSTFWQHNLSVNSSPIKTTDDLLDESSLGDLNEFMMLYHKQFAVSGGGIDSTVDEQKSMLLSDLQWT